MPKQIEIPGTETPRIAEIDEAAEAFVAIRDKWQAHGKKLIEAKEALIQVCVAHTKEMAPDGEGNRLYKYDDDMMVILKPSKNNVKVKHVHEDEDEDE
jgi:hypothetical protein